MASLPPPISPAHRPPLEEIDEYAFQQLTVDLLSREDDLKLARLYGERGQLQRGADATAECKTGGLLVAQCKRYKKVQPALIREACGEFLEHYEFWISQGAQRFVIALASDASSPAVVAEIRQQTNRLSKKKLGFEVWDRQTLVQKVRLHSDLVRQYLGGEHTWVSLLCGVQSRREVVPSPTSDADRVALGEMLADFAEREVTRLRDALRRGHRTEVRKKLLDVKGNTRVWELLPGHVKATVLRLQAGLILDSGGDIEEVRGLITSSEALDPQQSVVWLRLRLLLQQVSPENALAAIPEKQDAQTLGARGSLFLILADSDSALRSLEASAALAPKDIDTLRLLALTHAARGDLAGAHDVLSRLNELAPEWELVRWTRAVVLYMSTLAVPSMQSAAQAVPEPLAWAFIRRDDVSIQYLEEAETIFHSLAGSLDRTAKERQFLEAWRLGCLANNPNRQKEAAEYAAQLTARHPCNLHAFPWVVARGYSVDASRVEAIALRAVESDRSDILPVLIVAGCKLQTNEFASGMKLLEVERHRFAEQGQLAVWSHWWATFLIASGDPDAALTFIRSSEKHAELRQVESIALEAQSKRRGEPGLFSEWLSSVEKASGNPRALFDWADRQARLGNWMAVSERSTELLKVLPTLDVLYLVLSADFQTGRHERCLSRIAENIAILPARKPSIDLRRLRVGCLERLGRAREALTEADALRADDASTSTLVSFVRLCLGFGDVTRGLTAARELLARPDLPPDDAVEMAELLLVFSPTLSREFLSQLTPSTVPEDHVMAAFDVAQRLSISQQRRELLARMPELAKNEFGGVHAVSVNAAVSLLAQMQENRDALGELYRLGRIPIHRFVDEGGMNLPVVYCVSVRGNHLFQ